MCLNGFGHGSTSFSAKVIQQWHRFELSRPKVYITKCGKTRLSVSCLNE